jgi:hypothetical protein
MVDVFMGGIVKMMVFDQLIFLELLDDKFFISFYVCSLGCLSWFDCFLQVEDEQDTVAEKEKEKEGFDEEEPEKEDADEETDVADRRPTLQRNYNTDDSHPLASVDPQARMKDGPLSDANNKARPYPHNDRPREIRHRDRGFLVRVSTPASQHVSVLVLESTFPGLVFYEDEAEALLGDVQSGPNVWSLYRVGRHLWHALHSSFSCASTRNTVMLSLAYLTSPFCI